MAADPRPLLADLVGETQALTGILDALPASEWRMPTPAVGWTIGDQVSHLAYFDETTLLSLTDPHRFRRAAAALLAGGDDFADRVALAHRHLDAAALLAWFRAERASLVEGYARTDPAGRLPWYGPDMGVASSITARIMETWAHGQDVADALGVTRAPTARLRHIAHLGIRALPYSFTVRGLAVPTAPIRVELAGPDGATWVWGPPDAEDRITASALDFCLVVTQRRHRDDTDLVSTGATADAWIRIAQAFAGPPGPGRAPIGRQRRPA